MIDDVLDDVVNRVIDALDHAGEHKAWLHHVLIRIDTDHEMSGAPILNALLLDSIERSQAGVTCGGEDHVSAFSDLRQREFFPLARIVPRSVSHANVVSDHMYVLVN